MLHACCKRRDQCTPLSVTCPRERFPVRAPRVLADIGRNTTFTGAPLCTTSDVPLLQVALAQFVAPNAVSIFQTHWRLHGRLARLNFPPGLPVPGISFPASFHVGMNAYRGAAS